MNRANECEWKISSFSKNAWFVRRKAAARPDWMKGIEKYANGMKKKRKRAARQHRHRSECVKSNDEIQIYSRHSRAATVLRLTIWPKKKAKQDESGRDSIGLEKCWTHTWSLPPRAEPGFSFSIVGRKGKAANWRSERLEHMSRRNRRRERKQTAAAATNQRKRWKAW